MQQARRPLEPHADRVNKLKSNLYYTHGITLKRVTSGEVHLRCFAPGNTFTKTRRSGGKPWATLCRFDRPGNRTPDLPHR